MTENSEPIHELGIQDAEGNFTALAALDYDTVNDELSLKHLQQDVELRTDGTSWNPNAPLGDETQPVPGTSHFNAISTPTITGGSGTSYDVDNDLVSERLLNVDTETLFNGPASPTDSVTVTLNADNYDMFSYRISIAPVSGSTDIELTFSGGGAGDYAYVERDRSTLTEVNPADFILICTAAVTGTATGQIWLSPEGRPHVQDMHYTELNFAAHGIEGETTTTMSGDFDITVSAADAANRIDNISIQGGVKQ